jgi:potassium channel subfamily K
LMGNTNEPEWLLQRLTAKLEAEMRRMSSRNKKERVRKPPISMADAQKNGGGDEKEVGEPQKGADRAEVHHQEYTSEQ